MSFSSDLISFHRLRQSDLSLMYCWLRNPAVEAWYGPAPESYAEVEAKYEPRISGGVPVDCYIARYQNRPVGYIQTYLIESEPDYAAALEVDRGAAGVDLFIGEDDFRHRGFGPIMLSEFVKREVFTRWDVTCCIIAPDVTNEAAIRAYAKAGFRHLKTVPVPGEPEPEYVMVLRPEKLSDAIAELDQEQEP